MSRKAFVAVLVGLVLVTAGFGTAVAHDTRFRDDCWNCWGPGPGYPGPYMGPWYGYGRGYGPRGYGWWGPDRSAFGHTLSKGEAEKLVEWIIGRNPNLAVGEVTEVEGGYKVQVVTRKGKNLVDLLMVEKDTGWVYRIYD